MASTPSARHRGWFWDETNSSLEIYNGSQSREVGFTSGGGMVIDRGGLTVTGSVVAVAATGGACECGSGHGLSGGAGGACGNGGPVTLTGGAGGAGGGGGNIVLNGGDGGACCTSGGNIRVVPGVGDCGTVGTLQIISGACGCAQGLPDFDSCGCSGFDVGSVGRRTIACVGEVLVIKAS